MSGVDDPMERRCEERGRPPGVCPCFPGALPQETSAAQDNTRWVLCESVNAGARKG